MRRVRALLASYRRSTMSAGEIAVIFRARLREPAIVVQEALAVVGIAVGVALLFASQVASASLDGSVRQINRQVVGDTQWQLESPGPEGFDGAVAAGVERLPGVSAALPVVERHATIVGPRGQTSVDLFGADPRFAHVGSELLRHFNAANLARQQAIALPAPLAAAIGARSLDVVKVQVGGRTRETLLGATLQAGDIGGLVHGAIAFAPIEYGQRLISMTGRISRLYVRVQGAHAAEAKRALAALAARERLLLVPADWDARQFSVAADPAQKGEWLFSALSAVVGFLFAFNAMLLTVPSRRSLIETMRRRGTTRLMTVQMLCCDALVLGALACLVGIGLGELLSAHVFAPRPGYLAYAFPVGTQRIVNASTVLIAIGAGMAAALVGVLVPMRAIVKRTLRNRADHEAQRDWTRVQVGVGASCVAGAALILALAPAQAVPAALILVIALLALLPLLFSAAMRLLEGVQRSLDSVSLKLALTELNDPVTRVRSMAVAATGAIAVFGSVAILGAQSNLQKGLDGTARGWNGIAQVWVSPSGAYNTLGITPFAASRLREVAALRGVAGVSVYRGGFLNLGRRRLWVIAPPKRARQLVPAGQILSGDPSRAERRLRAGGWAVVSEAVARELHLHVGASLTLPSPVPTRFRVAALSTNSGWPPGAVVINAADYAAAWRTSAASALLVTLDPGVAPAQARRELQAVFPHGSGLSVQTAAEREREWVDASHEGLARLSQIGTLMLIAATLAMAGVMTSMTWQRRRRIAYIKRQGFSRGLLWKALCSESAILLVVGCGIGAGFGLFGQLLISHALRAVTGFPISIALAPLVALASIGFVSGAALAIVALPGYRAVCVRATAAGA